MTQSALPRGPRVALLVMFVLVVLAPIAAGALDRAELRCTRDGSLVHCESVQTLVGLERERRRIEDVTGARTDFTPVKKARGTYRTVLLTRAGEVRLSDAFNWNDEADIALADQVSGFLGGAEPTLSFAQPGWGWLLVLCMTLFWAAMWFGLPWLTARSANRV